MPMPQQQRTFYFAADDPDPVHRNNYRWNTALPLDRNQHPGPGETPAGEGLTYGEYFEAVTEFLSSHQSDFIAKAVFHIVNRPIDPGEISHIQIHLEKHGAFYHPARIVMSLTDSQISLVLNVAVSKRGKEIIRNEYRQLRQLAKRVSSTWVPRVFGWDRVRIDGQRHVQMFLGEWFEDFHEFHVSKKNGPGETGIRVWDPDNGNLFFSHQQARHVFHQAAMILTAYYNIETFEQIASWHHAAGDFVVCLQGEEPSLKLITVRGYKPLFNLSGDIDGLETILNTLLIFLLNLSIRLRVDRMDGVGEVVWVALDVVPDIISGFFKGLVIQAEASHIPPALIDAFKSFLLHLPESDIRDIFKGLVRQLDLKNPDLPVMKHNLEKHVGVFLSELRLMKTAL